MNFTKQTAYALEQNYDNYWLRRAAEEVIEGWGLGALELCDIRFSTQELAVEAARAVLQRHMELTPHCGYPRFNSADDLVTATKSIPARSASARIDKEGRFIGEPVWTHRDGALEMVRPTEVRLLSHGTTTKTVVVDGETYIKEVDEWQESDWFKGAPEVIRLQIITVNQVTAG
jgi:hypothetical protein